MKVLQVLDDPTPEPQVASTEQGSIFSSPKGFFGPGILANINSRMTGRTPEESYKVIKGPLETAATVAGSMVGPNPASFLGKLGVSAGISGAGAGLGALGEGKGLKEAGESAGLGAALGAAGESTAKGIRYLFSALPKNMLGSKTGRDLASWFKSNVPAWSSLKGNPKGLYEMAHGEGQNLLSAAFDPEMEKVIQLGKGRAMEISEEAARALKIPPATGQGTPIVSSAVAKGKPAVQVDAGEAAEKALGMWKKYPGQYREVVDALDKAGIGDPEARRAYQLGAGWIEFARKGKFLHGQSYDPVKAQEAFDRFGAQSLLRRNMQPVRQMIEGAGPIKKGDAGAIGGALGAAVGGAAGGSAFPVLGHLGGGGGGFWLGRHIGKSIPTYGNVPTQLPQIERLRRALMEAGIIQGTE